MQFDLLVVAYQDWFSYFIVTVVWYFERYALSLEFLLGGIRYNLYRYCPIYPRFADWWPVATAGAMLLLPTPGEKDLKIYAFINI